MEIFHRIGLAEAFRISHVIVAVMWMGLLWFFNFVQTPAYAEMEAGSRNDAFDKLTWRALWWFRWSAAATVVFGLLIIAIAPKGTLRQATSGSTARAGADAADRHPVRPHDVPQRVARDLAEPADRDRQRPHVKAGGEAEPERRGRGPRRRDGVAAEHDLLAAAAGVHGRRVALLRRSGRASAADSAAASASSTSSSGSSCSPCSS